MHCTHADTRTLSVRAFVGPVSVDENRAAHGNVTMEVECVACGARQMRNVNGVHVETGTWGLTRAQRFAAAAAAEVQAIQARAFRPEPLTLFRGDLSVQLAVDEEGWILVDGDAPHPTVDQIAAVAPAFVRAAAAFRRAVLEASRCRLAV